MKSQFPTFSTCFVIWCCTIHEVLVHDCIESNFCWALSPSYVLCFLEAEIALVVDILYSLVNHGCKLTSNLSSASLSYCEPWAWLYHKQSILPNMKSPICSTWICLKGGHNFSNDNHKWTIPVGSLEQSPNFNNLNFGEPWLPRIFIIVTRT